MLIRCADAFETYINLRKQLTKTGNEKKYLKLLEYEAAKDKRLLQNTTFTSRFTHIGFVTEDRAEFDALSTKNYEHLVHTDRIAVPEGHQMVALEGTLKLAQVEGEVVPDATTTKYNLVSSNLPCACTSCRAGNAFTQCAYAGIRVNRRSDIKMTTDFTTATRHTCSAADDPYDFMTLNCDELRGELNGRGIATPRMLKKVDLIALLTEVTAEEEERDDAGT